MSGSELAGDLVDAALVASVVDDLESNAGAADGHTHETACLNCGTPLDGPFCSECGQAAHVHRTLAAFFHDLLHGAFHFEGRIWHTLPMLVLQPGALTRRYINGQRARFISPLALFLFCVFLLYATIQQTAHNSPPELRNTNPDRLQAAEAQLTKLEAQRRIEIARHQDTDDSDAAITTLQTVVGTLKRKATTASTNGQEQPTSFAFLNRIINSIKENPELALYKVEMHAYKFSWLLIPISVPFVWLMFPFDRRFPIYDHTVFVTYSISFMTLLSVIVLIVDALGLDAGWLLVVVAPLHIYRQLRGAYQCSRLGAVMRTVGLTVAAGAALAIFAGLIVAGSTD